MHSALRTTQGADSPSSGMRSRSVGFLDCVERRGIGTLRGGIGSGARVTIGSGAWISGTSDGATHGKLGSIVYTPKGGVKRIPALIGEAIDTIGAGDAFFALAAPLVAKGSDPFLAAFIGNAVGAMKVRIVGQRHQITKPEILKYLSTLLK